MFGQAIPIHVIDYEGTRSYGVVEFGVATLVGGEISETHTRICKANAPIDPEDIAVHGLTYERTQKHAPFDVEYDFFVDLRSRGPLAAHNANYESRLTRETWAFPPMVPAFKQEGQLASWGPWIDSMILARRLAPGLSRYRLQTVVEELGLDNELNAITLDRCPEDRRHYHAALFDAIASALILKKLLLEGETPISDERIFCVK